ncbi:phosphatidylinositol 4-phosphate-binding protein [Saccharomycopsis crataegensis]|uniref:Phosphatidylinositol 4-phosphate-binding protein n=1 Tax=Saccharomycopsis crataegensis TaxID=43959 RepID=A0AAV5QMG2_9ASCO|nr:phosphatidylinositol 4-phosphate-binding protein [Saccharomycopsis crataegensis]
MSASEGGPSRLVRRIYKSCRAAEPDLALNFEIADLVNEKQGAAPREAALTVVKFINDRDPFVGINALTLLDCLVKNCGYPFHLQISRKEFLNEMVKRFPDKPPYKYNKVQKLILGQIEEWHETICKSSRYKKDLGFIRDMHRLLALKGYIFPEINKSDLAVLNPSENLKSIEEIQKEERVAQSAKLQELIRRGRPEDLAEANKLMKIMSGFQEDKKTNEMTRQKIAEDISKIKGKIEVFSDMVNNYNENDANNAGNNETLEELYTSLKVSQPTLMKIIEEEHDDQETVNNLLKVNDTINLLVQKYSLIKKKDLNGAAKINVGASGQMNLIDFDDGDASQSNSASPAPEAFPKNKDSLIDLLGDLDLSSASRTISPAGNGTSSLNFGTGAIALGLNSSNTSTPTPPPVSSTASAFESLTQLQNLDQISSSPLNQGSLSQQMHAGQTNNLLQTNQSLLYQTSTSTLQGNATVHESTFMKISYNVLPRTSTSEVSLQFSLSNLSLKNISNITFLLALPKSFKLELNPQSNNFLMGMSTNGITQIAKVSSAPGQPLSGPIKMKWKLTYEVDGDNKNETGVYLVEKYD